MIFVFVHIVLNYFDLELPLTSNVIHYQNSLI